MLMNQLPYHQLGNSTRIETAQAILAKYDIQYLYHMTSIENLSSILNYGLVSHNQAHRWDLTKADISDVDVQDIRQRKFVNKIRLHNYVPLYFNPKNPMLYRRKNLQNNIAILAINPLVLFKKNTVFSDGNASCRNTSFYTNIKMLSELNWETIWTTYWHNKYDGKRIRCAEVLVYPDLAVDQIFKVYCKSKQASLAVTNNMPAGISLPVEVNKCLYF